MQTPSAVGRCSPARCRTCRPGTGSRSTGWSTTGGPRTPTCGPKACRSPRRRCWRPGTDPFLVDVCSYTEYYRMRASVFAGAPLPDRARRYDLPGPHAPGSPDLAAAAFDMLGATTGWQSRSTRRTARLMYALLVGLANQVGAGIDGPTLPPSRSFELRPRPAAEPHFNALHGRRSAGTPGRRRCAATRRRAHPRRGAAAQAARAGGAVAVRHEVDHRRVRQLRGLAAVRR